MLLSRLPSSSVRVFPFCRRFSCLPDSSFGAASLLAQRRPWCHAVFADACPALSFGRKHQTRRRPSLRPTSSPPLTFVLNSSLFLMPPQLPFSARKRRRVAPLLASATWVPRREIGLRPLVSHNLCLFPLEIPPGPDTVWQRLARYRAPLGQPELHPLE